MNTNEKKLEELLYHFYTTLNRIVKENKTNYKGRDSHDDISESQVQYLKAIDKLRIPTLSELTKEMGYSKASVSISIQKLEKKGLIKKRQSETDKRSYYLIITGKGVNKVNSQKDTLKDYIKQMILKLSDSEIEQFESILEKITST
jgi:DNA-binding MarR family transcriptional regulator